MGKTEIINNIVKILLSDEGKKLVAFVSVSNNKIICTATDGTLFKIDISKT
ncbi:MAG: hypothetical protein R3Y32_04140 [Bacillota bacterium]